MEVNRVYTCPLRVIKRKSLFVTREAWSVDLTRVK